MDILSIPFHRLLNIERSQNDNDYIFQIDERSELHNRLELVDNPGRDS